MAIKFPKFSKNMFDSARLKLTLFYFAVLVVFCLTITIGTRELALDAYRNSDAAQRGQFHHLLDHVFPFETDQAPPGVVPSPDSGIESIQDKQEAVVRQHLTVDLIFINILALAVGGAISYWYAGRTLRPIEQSHENQKRFASDASHELRTPLTNMRVENEVFLRQKDFTSKEARELIESNLEEVQRLESLSGNLLSLAQYDNIDLEMSDVLTRHIIDGAVANVAKAAEAKKIEVNVDAKATKVRGQEESLKELLTIILDNAVKYSPEKSKVMVTGAAEGNDYLVNVRDQGPGIDEIDMPHIFERLYRGDKARTSKTGGYGLGLSLAQEIANANHASIEVNNNESGGAQFTIKMNKS